MTDGRISPYPGCAPFSWKVATRVCDKTQDADACIQIFGKKGAGKSTASLALAEGIATDIAYLRARGEDASKFFSINNVISVTREGAIRLLTSGVLKQENSVILLDDVSLQWNSRRAMSWINTALNDILTIARVFKCVVIMNCVSSSHLDVVARNMTDYSITLVSKNTHTGQSVMKIYMVEQGETGAVYKKFLRYNGMRVKYWICGKPSDELNAQYKEMRLTNTTAHIDESYEKMKEKLGDNDGEPRVDKRVRDYAQMPDLVENRETFVRLISSGAKVAEISRETGLTYYRTQRCLAVLRKEGIS